jgi:hypothetical protein
MSCSESPEVSCDENEVEVVPTGEREVLASDMMQDEEPEDSEEAKSEAGEKAIGVKP